MLNMKNLYKALAAFQQEVPIIHKSTEGYGYSYADLPTVIEKITPMLKKHGLGFTQLGIDGGIKTVIFHSESGESIESFFDIPQNVTLAKMNAFQVLGSAISYIRRYALSSALGLVTDKDSDGNGAVDNKQSSEQASAPDKPWFNAFTKDGKVTKEGEGFIEEVKEQGFEVAYNTRTNAFKISGKTKAWMISFKNTQPEAQQKKMTRKEGQELIKSKITIKGIDEKTLNEITYELTDDKHQADRNNVIIKLNEGAIPSDVLTYLLSK